MHSIYKLTGSIQHYVWGGRDYIPELLAIEKTAPYYAEYWLGAHPSAPSIIEVGEKKQPLTEFLAQYSNVLGQASQAKFSNQLPYLLKILDVKKPLSIQLHPTKLQAEQGFERENAQALALDDPKRSYKDNNHKPEMMIALSDFWLLHGFKAKADIILSLKQRSSLKRLAEKLVQQDIHSFYADIMQADQKQLEAWILPIVEQNKKACQAQQLALDNPDYWLIYTIDAMDISHKKLDAGLLCFYLFNIVHLKLGEGIYQAAGIPHAYLRGQNIELMACSDNVIRGGLTPKHIDITELLKIIDCQEITPKIIEAAPPTEDILTYPTPAQDFALTNIRYVQQQQHQFISQSAEILLVMEGSIKLLSAQHELLLKQGESAFISANTSYQIDGLDKGYSIVAKLP